MARHGAMGGGKLLGGLAPSMGACRVKGRPTTRLLPAPLSFLATRRSRKPRGATASSRAAQTRSSRARTLVSSLLKTNLPLKGTAAAENGAWRTWRVPMHA